MNFKFNDVGIGEFGTFLKLCCHIMPQGTDLEISDLEKLFRSWDYEDLNRMIDGEEKVDLHDLFNMLASIMEHWEGGG